MTSRDYSTQKAVEVTSNSQAQPSIQQVWWRMCALGFLVNTVHPHRRQKKHTARGASGCLESFSEFTMNQICLGQNCRSHLKTKRAPWLEQRVWDGPAPQKGRETAQWAPLSPEFHLFVLREEQLITIIPEFNTATLLYLKTQQTILKEAKE